MCVPKLRKINESLEIVCQALYTCCDFSRDARELTQISKQFVFIKWLRNYAFNTFRRVTSIDLHIIQCLASFRRYTISKWMLWCHLLIYKDACKSMLPSGHHTRWEGLNKISGLAFDYIVNSRAFIFLLAFLCRRIRVNSVLMLNLCVGGRVGEKGDWIEQHHTTHPLLSSYKPRAVLALSLPPFLHWCCPWQNCQRAKCPT